MRFYKIGNRWIDLDHVLEITEPTLKYDSCLGDCLTFFLTMMFLEKEIQVSIVLHYEIPEEDGDFVMVKYGNHDIKERSNQYHDKRSKLSEAEYLRVKWTVYNDFLKQFNINQEQ